MTKIKGWYFLKGMIIYVNGTLMKCKDLVTHKGTKFPHMIAHQADFFTPDYNIDKHGNFFKLTIFVMNNGDVIIRIFNQDGTIIDSRQTHLSKIRNESPITFIDDNQKLFYKKT